MSNVADGGPARRGDRHRAGHGPVRAPGVRDAVTGARALVRGPDERSRGAAHRGRRGACTTHHAPVVVVGAGPAGLAVARALARRGVAATVLERDRVAASWARHYDHLKLHTRKGAAALPGLRFPAGDAHLPAPRRRGRRTCARTRSGSCPTCARGWTCQGLAPVPADVRWGRRLAPRDERRHAFAARAVVVATGIASAPFTPRDPGRRRRSAAACGTPPGPYRGAAGAAGRRVRLVVGAPATPASTWRWRSRAPRRRWTSPCATGWRWCRAPRR